MKTAIKLIALALVAVFAVVSCAPELELSSRNWTERTANQDTTKFSIGASLPLVSTNNLVVPFNNPGDREVVITFPAAADVLRQSNTNIAARMMEFANFHVYTQATADAPGILGEAQPYSFIRRAASGGNVAITVRLNASPSAHLVFVVDADKYTFANGRKVGGEGFNITGTSFWI
jgi:hypothetical protein